jgi:ubiquinone/menaquinone biosynthesis C-methylase UbiE
LDFPDAGFQTIVSIVVINWVDDPDRYLQECRRLLSKGGALVLAAAAPDRSRIFIRKLLGKSPPPQPHWMESLAAMTQRLRRHGFAVQTTDCFYEPFSDGFHTWKGFVNMTTNLPMRVCRATSFAPYYGIKAIA